jgi:hypothetical protein
MPSVEISDPNGYVFSRTTGELTRMRPAGRLADGCRQAATRPVSRPW